MSYWSPSKTEVLNLFGWFHGRQFFHRCCGWGWWFKWWGAAGGSLTTHLLLCGRFLTGHQPDTSSAGIFISLRLPGGFPGGWVVKTLPANAGDTGDAGSIPGSGRSLEGGNGNPLQYCCLGNPMERSLAGYSPQGCRVEHDWAQHT